MSTAVNPNTGREGSVRRTSAQLVLYFYVLLRGHTEEGRYAVTVCIPVCEATGGHAARRSGRDGMISVSSHG